MNNRPTFINKGIEVTSKKTQQGVMLLEVLIALLIFSMGILALVGLQAAMVSNTTNAKYRADASYIAQQKIGEMWADSDNAQAYAVTTDVSAQLPNGEVVITNLAGDEYEVQVKWRAPGETVDHNVTMNATISKVL